MQNIHSVDIIYPMQTIERATKCAAGKKPGVDPLEASRVKLIEHIIQLNKMLEQLEQALRPIIPREWTNTDITMPQLRVLLVLYREGPKRMSAVAASLGVSLASATGIVDRLVERGLVARGNSADDRRVVLCRLSHKGEQLMDRLWESGRGQIRSLLEMMTTDQLEIVAKGTEAFIQVAQNLSDKAVKAKAEK